MRLVVWAFLLLCPVTIGFSCWTFLFPLWRGCTFPTKDDSYSPSLSQRALDLLIGHDKKQHPSAEFRLLAFGDPQLEGDTSIWHPNKKALYRPSVFFKELKESDNIWRQLEVFRNATRDAITKALPFQIQAWRKQLDLLGNDYYLAHIFRSVHSATQPTHVTVLGDLLGSQWIDDDEFEQRRWRFWNRVFSNGIKIENSTTHTRTDEILGADPLWAKRVINVAGNHDIGYAGDITEDRVVRFERAFGSANWHIVFHNPYNESSEAHPTLRLVVLNSMNLDAPAASYELQLGTYAFVNEVISDLYPVEDQSAATILLTHIPLHKEAGVCVDGPFFDFHEDGGGLKEQNHLTHDASIGVVLQGLYGMSGNPASPNGGFGRPGLILNGHDHEGCDTYHYLPKDENEDETRFWKQARLDDSKDWQQQHIPGIREVTLRAMMGEFGGFAYMISAWFDYDTGRWNFRVNSCSAGVQHYWWVTQVLLIITSVLGGAVVITELAFPASTPALRKAQGKTTSNPPKNTKKNAKKSNTPRKR